MSYSVANDDAVVARARRLLTAIKDKRETLSDLVQSSRAHNIVMTSGTEGLTDGADTARLQAVHNEQLAQKLTRFLAERRGRVLRMVEEKKEEGLELQKDMRINNGDDSVCASVYVEEVVGGYQASCYADGSAWNVTAEKEISIDPCRGADQRSLPIKDRRQSYKKDCMSYTTDMTSVTEPLSDNTTSHFSSNTYDSTAKKPCYRMDGQLLGDTIIDDECSKPLEDVLRSKSASCSDREADPVKTQTNIRSNESFTDASDIDEAVAHRIAFNKHSRTRNIYPTKDDEQIRYNACSSNIPSSDDYSYIRPFENDAALSALNTACKSDAPEASAVLRGTQQEKRSTSNPSKPKSSTENLRLEHMRIVEGKRGGLAMASGNTNLGHQKSMSFDISAMTLLGKEANSRNNRGFLQQSRSYEEYSSAEVSYLGRQSHQQINDSSAENDSQNYMKIKIDHGSYMQEEEDVRWEYLNEDRVLDKRKAMSNDESFDRKDPNLSVGFSMSLQEKRQAQQACAESQFEMPVDLLLKNSLHKKQIDNNDSASETSSISDHSYHGRPLYIGNLYSSESKITCDRPCDEAIDVKDACATLFSNYRKTRVIVHDSDGEDLSISVIVSDDSSMDFTSDSNTSGWISEDGNRSVLTFLVEKSQPKRGKHAQTKMLANEIFDSLHGLDISVKEEMCIGQASKEGRHTSCGIPTDPSYAEISQPNGSYSSITETRWVLVNRSKPKRNSVQHVKWDLKTSAVNSKMKSRALMLTEKEADERTRVNRGLYAIALASGLKFDSSFEIKIRPSAISVAQPLRLSSDFRCGAQGSLYDITIRSGVDLATPWAWKKNKKFMPARGGLWYISGLDKKALRSRKPYSLKTLPVSSYGDDEATVLPEDITDNECGATGNLFLAFETAGGGYKAAGSLYYLASHSGMST